MYASTTMEPALRAATYASPRAQPPQLSASKSLLVHVRLPRENADENAAESPRNERKFAESLKRSRRRPRTDSSSDERVDPRGDDSTSDSSSVATGGDANARKKARKPTYVVQKEEKEALLQELHQLEDRAEALRAKVGMPSLAVHESTQQRQNENRKMESARRAQLLALCSVQSIFSGYMREQFAEPLKINVHLGRDMVQRRATLMGIRRSRLDFAYRYMEYRFHGIDDRLPMDDSMTWTSTDGDFCFCRTDVSHFPGVGVKQVFDALQYYISNMEITISEVLGQLTLREDIDCVDTRATNHRIVSSTDHGIVVESNTISFLEYQEHCSKRDGHEFAIFTGDSVEEDDLYPYCPHERVRKNITAVITLSAQRRPNSSGETELVVVMSRSAFVTLKKPQFFLTPEALEDLRGTVSAWGRVMTNTVRDHVYAQTTMKAGVAVPI